MRNLAIKNQHLLKKLLLLSSISLFGINSLLSQHTSASEKSGLDRLPSLSLQDSIKTKIKSAGLSLKNTLLSPTTLNRAQSILTLSETIKKDLTGPVDNLLRQPVKLNNAALSFQGYADSSYINPGNPYFQTNLHFVSDWSVAGIPVEISFQKQRWSDFTIQDMDNFSFRFDRNNYLSQLKKRLSEKIDPAALLNQIKSPFEEICKNLKQQLATELEGLSNQFKGILDNEVRQIKNLPDVFAADIKSLKDKYINASTIMDADAHQRLLVSLQDRINSGEKIDEEQLMNVREQASKLRALQELFNKMEQHKAKWEQSGLLKKIKDFDLLKKAGLSKLLNDPSTITKLAKQKLSLKGLEKLFLHINKLDIGQNSLTASPLSFNHFLSKGINTEFLSNKRSLLFVSGKQTDFNSILDMPFTGSPISNNGVSRAISIGSGVGTKNESNISVATFSQSMAGLMDQFNPAAFRQVLVTSISNQLSVGEKGMVRFELSRSATQYNALSRDSGSGNKSNLSGIFSGENFMDNTALSLKYTDELSEQGLSYHFNFSTTSNGYTNPGNSYLNAGSTEFGAGFRKVAFKNKLTVSFRGTSRSFNYGNRGDASWFNSNMLFDARWRLKKGQYVSLRYQPVRMIRKEEKNKVPVSIVERISLDANVYKKIGKIVYRNFVSLSNQRNVYSISDVSAIKSNSLMVSSFQQLLLGAKMLYVNFNYNHNSHASELVFLNSSLYSEAGYSYQVHKNITASSGLVYNYAANWYSQAGIRQTLSGQLGEKFSLNIYIDIKKNLKVFQALWNEPVRGDISLRYILNNKH